MRETSDRNVTYYKDRIFKIDGQQSICKSTKGCFEKSSRNTKFIIMFLLKYLFVLLTALVVKDTSFGDCHQLFTFPAVFFFSYKYDFPNSCLPTFNQIV